MSKIKSILKAFGVIAVIPILISLGIVCVAFVAPICFDGLSNPFFSFISLILMLPWGILFMMTFIGGINIMPSFVIYDVGGGGYVITKGGGRGGGVGFLFALLRMIFLIPTALIIWVVVSVIILFNPKLEKRISDAYEELIDGVKRWYKVAIFFLIIAPLIVVGLDALEEKMYSPEKLEVACTELYYTETVKNFSAVTADYYYADCYFFEYTINPNGLDLEKLKGEWQFTNKKTGNSFTLDAVNFVPYNWNWKVEDKNTDHPFNTTISIPCDDLEMAAVFADGTENVEITCRITYISLDSNIPVLGDWMFPTVSNEFKDGYEIEVKR